MTNTDGKDEFGLPILQTPPAFELPKLKYPKPVKAAADAYERAFEAWAEADGERYEAADRYTDAEAADAQALTEAVRDGRPHPGETSSTDAFAQLKYAHEKTRQAAVTARQAFYTLSAAIKEHAVEIADAASETALAGIDTWQQSLADISAKLIDAQIARQESFAGLQLLFQLNLTPAGFDPNFPLTDTVQLPSAQSDKSARSRIHQLRLSLGLEQSTNA